ncbi:uncharacterized protein LOC103312501 isoform X2 [Tribolium castaneum]|uniref:uncharacterized protein LOC103312501 isoform X2 n=1 Tax=Tribolium castaneum TaxID=7070 RepID=UPI00077DDBAB|nr:PREDICTED: uncharacterized protein LOC103312501 isoform X2 [Tribolium castaneum]|eukprot:XP_015834209.1 PREDICTED: uncharacterized protein LOC103312501 isoform X2 [Tribolium castaneum]
MSSNNFDEVLSSLQDAQDSAKLLKILIDVRKKVDADCPKNKENICKIREKGCFKQIVASLQTSKKSTINVSLSILGNCCLDAKCARDVISQYGALSNFNQLLKRYPKDDSINGRVFRIVGNLCQHRDQWAGVIIEKKPQIVIHIVKYLKDSVEEENGKVSEATITMGIRALRVLVNRETLQSLVTTYGVLKTVGMLLIKYGAIWQETKKGESVLINIVKLLHEYSRYRYYPSIQEMRSTDKGDSIVYLSKILLVAPRQVVKIVMNFLKISQLKSDLPVPEIFDSFIEVLSDDTIIQEFNSTCEECIKCLCYLLDHPGNRENERCGDSIPLLINVLSGLTLQTNNKIECSILIISTLKKCKYNFNLIADQVRCNIVTVLNEKIKLIVGSVDPLNINHKSDKKRRNNFLAKFKESKRSKLMVDLNEDEESSSSDSDEEIDKYYSSVRNDYSPGSSNESEMAMSWTSGLSPPSSPRSRLYGISESDSDDYSPVCSEVDPSDFPLAKPEGEESPNPEIDSKSSDISEETEEIQSFDVDSSSVKQIKGRLVLEIVDLLKTYIKIKPPITQLGTPELLLGLIKSTAYFHWPCSSAILDIVDLIYKILGSHNYLLPLMQSDFIPAVYDMAKIQHGSWCSKCRQFQWISASIIKKLSRVAETGGGKGDIAHKLLRGDNVTKQQLVLVIPYIIRSKAILVKLMLNCGGLEILMKLLKDQSALQTKSIKVLCVLASKKLGIPNPKNVSGIYKNVTGGNTGDTSSVVTFKLDDGSLLSADRGLLSRNSDFFARLLNGDFKESSQDVITLPNVNNKSLRCLLHWIKTDLVEIDIDLNTHLDVIGLCDRFLMEDYRCYLTDCVEKFRLSPDTIPTIYNWSLESRTNLLRVECIAYALVANIIDSERFEMFRNLFDLGYTEELVEDIRKLLVRYMTLNQFCDCKKHKNRNCDKKIHSIY